MPGSAPPAGRRIFAELVVLGQQALAQVEHRLVQREVDALALPPARVTRVQGQHHAQRAVDTPATVSPSDTPLRTGVRPGSALR